MRKNYIQVSSIALTSLSNSELVNLLTRLRELLPLKEATDDDMESRASENLGAPDLNISAEQVAELDEVLAKMHDLGRESKAKKTTASRKEVDKTRDALAVAIVDRVMTARKLPLAAERDAAETLYNMAKAYVGVSKLPLNDETEIIRGMLLDFAKPEYASAVSALELRELLNELKTQNELYAELVKEDNLARKVRRIAEGSSELRQTLYAIYQEMTQLAVASNTLHETEETRDFLDNLNTVIEDIKRNHNQRNPKKEEGDQKPEEEPTEPEEKPTDPDEDEGGGTHFEPVE